MRHNNKIKFIVLFLSYNTHFLFNLIGPYEITKTPVCNWFLSLYGVEGLLRLWIWESTLKPPITDYQHKWQEKWGQAEFLSFHLFATLFLTHIFPAFWRATLNIHVHDVLAEFLKSGGSKIFPTKFNNRPTHFFVFLQ